RVGVARALAADPPILLMDEPFGALDPVTRAELQREFSALARRLGKTIVFVTHDLREALLLASRIVMLEARATNSPPLPASPTPPPNPPAPPTVPPGSLSSYRKSTRLKECRSRWSPYH